MQPTPTPEQPPEMACGDANHSITGRIEIAGVERTTLNQMKGQHSEQRICLSPNNTTQPHSRGSNLGWPGMGDDG